MKPGKGWGCGASQVGTLDIGPDMDSNETYGGLRMRYIQEMAVEGIVLRTPSQRDAAAMAALMRRIYDETEFLN